jgi:DNA-binding CsgD family transcriptional regulator
MNTMLDAGFADPALLIASPGLSDSGADTLSTLIDILAHGLLVLDERGRLVHANQIARVELNRARVLCKAGDEIHAVNPADHKGLQLALTKAGAGKRSLINVTGAGSSLMLAVVPLKPEADSWKSRTALFFSRTEICESGMVGFFARSHGLTQTEEQVLTILCRGLSTPEIALQMKVAVSTVRSHVRSLCAKTGSSGVRELVNRVAVLPPVAPCHLVQIH